MVVCGVHLADGYEEGSGDEGEIPGEDPTGSLLAGHLLPVILHVEPAGGQHIVCFGHCWIYMLLR